MCMSNTATLPVTVPITVTEQEFVDRISECKGQFLPRITITRPCKVRKGEDPITKVSVGTYRSGIDYDNLQEVKTDRSTGDRPSENAGLPWGEWFRFPYSIVHRGTFYVRLYPLHGAKVEVHYYRNGVEIATDDAKKSCLASEFPKPKIKTDGEELKTVCNTVKLENISHIGKVEVTH